MVNIVCFHLFNDYSGSPKVLKFVLGNLLEKWYSVDLISSRGGVLDKLYKYPTFKHIDYSYRFSTNHIVTLIKYSIIQFYTFILAWRYLFQKDVVFYINTLLPVGPALAGRMMGKRVIYHYHENAFAKGAIYKMLSIAMQKLANEIICVSTYQASFLNRKNKVLVIPNALPKEFVNKLQPDKEAAFYRKTILMLSSLKEYKGTHEFIELASELPQYKFVLVINDTQANIGKYMDEHHISPLNNLTIYPRQNDVSSFYNHASVVLNLSDRFQFVETFGLTALEAMSAGLPVIVPTVGGIAEMVKDGVNGYKIDVQDLYEIGKRIKEMMNNEELYKRLSENAIEFSRKYSEENMMRQICNVLMYK